ncbi:MAG: sporulation protein YqfD [Syntrophomonadaceae bacterium]|jgi:similar to stage IV sporulation protein
MANKFFDQVGGVVSVRLHGKNPEKVINMALSRGVFLWNIKRKGDWLELKVRSSGFEALNTIVEETGHSLEVINKKGLPFLKTTFKRRIGFVSGALVFILALYFMSSFVWHIEVTGYERVDKNRILLTAAKYGVYKGAAKWSFSRTEVEEAMLRDIDELTYVRLNVKGVKVTIEVVEKIFPREEITGPCHIIASKDGVVEEILVLEGQVKIREGQAVSKGDILISGLVIPEINPFMQNVSDVPLEPYTVRARGVVKARVWYEAYAECPLRLEKTILTGNEQVKTYIDTPWKSIALKGRGDTENYPIYEEETDKNSLITPWGEFSLRKVTIKEKKQKVLKYSQGEAIENAKNKALADLVQKTGHKPKTEDIKVDILSVPSDSLSRVKLSVEIVEDIAVAEPIN